MGDQNTQLRRERQLRGWSQVYLAEQLGTPDYYISRWERGEVLPSPFYQQKLCELFGKTAEELGFLLPVKQILLPGMPRTNEEILLPSVDAKANSAMIVNPFTYGNPISDPKRFFGRRQEVDHVFSRLRNAEFESSSIVGERRIGKTSLLKYLAHPVVYQQYGLDPHKYLFVYIDLQMVDKSVTPPQLWRWLLRHMASCCNDTQVKQMLEEVRQTQSIDNFALEDLFDNIDAKDKYVVLLLDEFENVTENPNFNAAFFYSLRSLAIHHHLSLITSSRRELIELCHSQAIRSSPFFNIFANINTGLFTKNDALDLISQSLAGTDIHFTDTEIDTILHIAGYHPYFLQVACSFLFDAYPKNLHTYERTAYLRKAFREEAGRHLAVYWHNSDNYEKITLTALTLLERRHLTTSPSFSIYQLQDLYAHCSQTLARLEKRGLVASRGDAFSLFNESLGEWIWNEITDTRHNQQSYKEWLTSNKRAADHLKNFPDTTKKDVDEILSKMNEEYRELILLWLSEPRIATLVGGLIKGFLESGRR